MAKIQMQNNQLIVPDQVTIPYIIGDGIGPDIWSSAVRVMDAAIEKAYKGKRSIDWLEVLAGEKAFNTVGVWMPEKTLDTLKGHLVSIKGPLTTPIGGGIRSLNVQLRQELDLYACVRPVRYFQGVPSPVKHPERVNITIFRENTEDIYAGIEYAAETKEARKLIDFLTTELHATGIRFPETSGIGIKPVSKEGTKRLVRSAIDYAIKAKLPTVTLVHKGNIMKYTEGAFKKWGYDLAEDEYGDFVFTWQTFERIKETDGIEAAKLAERKAIESGKIIVKDIIADIFLQQVLLRPQTFDVVATLNLNGDYASDALAAQVGGIGIAPGANINYTTGHAMFEATHGTAPKYAGKNVMNPSSVLLSGAMMFDHLGWREASELIERSMEKTIADKTVTLDFARQMTDATELSTSEFGDALIRNM